ncbi:nuclear transport factor 2 family protein [Sphingomonas crocodyli]|uniref:Nuclear transport factor 2 family protein n=1 Tax=Sphingomonas crocodyli TaxID=1979270 RepID=A0A437M7T6_9SPHN|nr:nuclear transport factor 2 family protein [Sphingomonas crocodyli]RVT93595.1 nuclear transport factor 2 family protein [Sphingomonas crocodyli]
MTYTLQQLSDFEDIRTLKHRYFRGIDTADLALLDTLFTDDLVVEYRGGDYCVKLTGRTDMVEFLANSFNAQAVAMHHGHMPEIELTGPDSATGIWYLEDIFISLGQRRHTMGSAIYRDVYRREDGRWKIARTEYDRIIEVVRPLGPDERITAHHLAKAGRPTDQVRDISHLISFT